MRQRTWSEQLPHHPDEPERDPGLERERLRSSRVRPFAVSALGLIAAALIVVILAAAL